jgi:hypothetical protein
MPEAQSHLGCILNRVPYRDEAPEYYTDVGHFRGQKTTNLLSSEIAIRIQICPASPALRSWRTGSAVTRVCFIIKREAHQ